jgi:hypothetical protein
MKASDFIVILGSFFIITTSTVYGQEANISDLAKQAQNPIASLISLPFQNNTNFGIGPDDETQNVLNVQPVWPFSLNENWKLITRTILPVISQPDILTGGEGRREEGYGGNSV